MMSSKGIWAFSTMILLVSTVVLITPVVALADSSDIVDCSRSFSGTLSEPFNAETMITIGATRGNYDVEFDYAFAVGEQGTVSFVKASALEPSRVILVEDETISTLLTSGETIPEGSLKLYHQDVSDCDILFDSSSIPDSKIIVLPTVSVTEIESGKFLVNATIPDKESATNFTKLVIAFVTNPEASVSYNIGNVNIVAADDDGTEECDIEFRKIDTIISTANDIVRLNSVLGQSYDIGLDYIGDFGTTANYYADNNAVNPIGDVRFQEGEIISFNIRSTGGATDQIYPSVFLVNKGLSDCDMLSKGAPESVPFIVTDIQGAHPDYAVTIEVPDSNKILGPSFSKMVISFAETPESIAYYVIPDKVSILNRVETIAEAVSRATGQSMFAGGRTLYGERFEPEAEVVGKVVDCATVELRKHGSPTGLARVGFFDLFLNEVRAFGTIDVSSLKTGYKSYEFCLPSTENGHLIKASQILAVAYDDGDALNRIDVRRSNTGAGPNYDGVAAFHVNFDTTMHVYNAEGNSRDLLFKLTNN